MENHMSLDLTNVDWNAYLTANPDVAASGMDPATHWNLHGQYEVGRSLGFQPGVANQGQFYNQRDGTPIGPTNAAEMNAFANNNFTDHSGFNPDTMAGTGGGITDPTIVNPDVVSFVQNGGSIVDFNPGSVGVGSGAGGGAGQPQNAFDQNAFMSQMQDLFSDMQSQWQQNQQSQWDSMFNNMSQWQQGQQSHWDSMFDNMSRWGESAYNGASETNNNFQAGYPTNVSPVYNPNNNGTIPRNGWGGPLGNNNAWSPTF